MSYIRQGPFYFVLFILLTVTLLRSLVPSGQILNQSQKSCDTDFSSMISEYRQCLLSQLNKTEIRVWTFLNLAINRCTRKFGLKFDFRWLYNKDDVKLVILPVSDSECTTVTLGIGGDVTAEQKLKKLLPYCQFYGADPILESGRVYETVGKYFQFAVGAEDGPIQASVLENRDYHFKNISAVSLDSFLKKQINKSFIDFFWIDNEGPEFEIFRKYFVESADFTVCQLMVEMHAPLDDYRMSHESFNRLMVSMISRSELVPVWSKAPNQHIQTLYLNVRNPLCLKKYLEGSFC